MASVEAFEEAFSHGDEKGDTWALRRRLFAELILVGAERSAVPPVGYRPGQGGAGIRRSPDCASYGVDRRIAVQVSPAQKLSTARRNL